MAGSAGANITEIYAACVCNPKYAALLGVEPVLKPESLKVLAIDEAALDASVFDKNMYAMLGCATGAKHNTPEAVAIINAICFGPMYNNVSGFLNASKVQLSDETVAQSRATVQKVGEEGVDTD